MNERDSESVLAMLIKHGYCPAESEDSADIVMVNTCSVREKAEDKAIGKLGKLVSESRKKSSDGGSRRIVGAVGCMVQRMEQNIFKRVKGLDFAVGPRSFGSIPAMIEAVQSGESGLLDTDDGEYHADIACAHLSGGISSFVNILLGCDRRCAYCIVPRVRGGEWSRAAEDILGEIRGLAENGVKEVTLLGQSVMSYGRKGGVWSDDHVSGLGLKEPFPRLLEAVDAIDGIERIRFTSGHPSGCTEELAKVMSRGGKVCNHIHLPVQSGSDRILKSMRRGYTVDEYREGVNRIRSTVKDLAITTDIIVGFPGETEREFELTRAFMDEIGFDNAFIFKYSPRPGTPAAEVEDDVSDDEKMRRNKILLADQDKRGLEKNKAYCGRVVKILAEGPSLRNEERWSGRTESNKIVVFEPVRTVSVGEIVDVMVERAMAQTLYGRLI